MLNLKINTTRRISTADMRLALDPPLYFEVKTYINAALNSRMADWEEAGLSRDTETAAEIISQVFISVIQDTVAYPLTTKADALALRDAIEEAGPGLGDEYLAAILTGFIGNHYRFFMTVPPASVSLSPELDTGNSNGNTPLPAKL